MLVNMAMWSPWKGCREYSEGCRFCYIHKGGAKRGIDTHTVCRAEEEHFRYPVRKTKKGEYKIKPGELVYLCFSSDFLISEADPWRSECWSMIRQRGDLRFLFLTKRTERLEGCLPPDWGDGYDNVTVGCTVENQAAADSRLPVFLSVPVKHRNIICQPLLEGLDIEKYLSGVELVCAGGESDASARPLNYDWVLDIREQCFRQGVHFNFRQCGTHFIKDGKEYTLKVKDLCAQARKAKIDI